MKNMDFMRLQLFAEAVAGKKLVYLYRILENASTGSGAQIAFTTENERTKSKDADSTATKDGSIRVPGVAEVEVTATSILMKGDTLIDELEAALDDNKLIEIWEVNLEEEQTSGAGKFKAKYFQGYLTEISKTSNAEDMVEVSLTFGINGDGVDGYATVTDEQQEVAAYVFADTQPSVLSFAAAFSVAEKAVSTVAGVIKSSLSSAISRVDTLNKYPQIMEQIRAMRQKE